MIRGNLLKKLKGVPFFENAETPIANELAIPADIQHTYAPPAMGNITNIQELIEAIQKMPVVISGAAYGKIAGQWYSVIFPRRLENPHVVCTAMARAGSFITSEIPRVSRPPLREIARAERPPLVDIIKEAKTDIPPINLQRPDKGYVISECRKSIHEYCEKDTEGWWWWPASAIADAVCDVIASVGSDVGRLLHWFWDRYIKKDVDALKKGTMDTINLVYNKLWNQTDKATTALQENINRLYTTETTDQINKVRDSITASMTDMYNSINSQVDQIRNRVNNVIRELYRMWGLPSGYILTAVHIRNITSTGFEFQSYGQTQIQYLAMGTQGE